MQHKFRIYISLNGNSGAVNTTHETFTLGEARYIIKQYIDAFKNGGYKLVYERASIKIYSFNSWAMKNGSYVVAERRTKIGVAKFQDETGNTNEIILERLDQ